MWTYSENHSATISIVQTHTFIFYIALIKDLKLTKSPSQTGAYSLVLQ